eukprot:NODE_163_length_16507_cov_1.031814.p5 type:complete len:283 gc:universal NODE_163_length_16507_cov_1.031814:15770-14922(-)
MDLPKIVFVGNISYDATEQGLKQVFSRVGPVNSFRLVTDKDTKRPKGYAFCEFYDHETASSAVRNMNGFEAFGRNLRVGWANEGLKNTSREVQQNLQKESERVQQQVAASLDPSQRSLFLQQQPNTQQAQQQAMPNVSTNLQIITNTLGNMQHDQLLQLITQVRELVISNPNEMQNILLSNPNLSFAVLQVLIMLNLVDQPTIQNILSQPVSQPQQPQYVQSAPVQQPIHQQPIQQPQQQQPQNVDQQALLRQVLALSQEQISSLPPDQQATVIQLRAAHGK